MAITKMKPRDDENGLEVIQKDGVTVVQGDITYPNLASAVQELVKTLQADEHNKVKAARIVDAIDRQELYKEAGVETFKAFLPVLLQQTAAIGWKSATSIKRYLGWYRLYLRTLQIEANAAISAVSHLQNLYVLAHIDRKSGELADPEGEGKLNPVQFEDIVRLVVWMVSGVTKAQLVEGMDAETTAQELQKAGLLHSRETYEELMGKLPELPARGWTLANTQEIIDRVKVAAEDEDAEEKAQRVWVGYTPFEGGVFVERIEFRRGEVKLDEIEVSKQYTTAHFELLRGKDAAEIAGKDGEQAGE